MKHINYWPKERNLGELNDEQLSSSTFKTNILSLQVLVAIISIFCLFILSSTQGFIGIWVALAIYMSLRTLAGFWRYFHLHIENFPTYVVQHSLTNNPKSAGICHNMLEKLMFLNCTCIHLQGWHWNRPVVFPPKLGSSCS